MCHNWVNAVGKKTPNIKSVAKAILGFAALGIVLAALALQPGEMADDAQTSPPPEIERQTEPPTIVLEASGESETEPHITETETETKSEQQTQTPGTATESETEAVTEADTTAVPEPTKPPLKAKREYQTQFDRVRGIYGNDDIIGIVKIPGTVVYYPVAHHDRNNEYYLERNLYKNRSAAGSICLDYENSVERHDPNTVLYGHQMSSNSMFHTLSYYTDKNFFEGHRYVIFNTIYENNVWEVFAFFKTDVSFNYIKVFFRSERDFLELAAQMKSRSLYDTAIEIKEGDRILTLSTCTNQEQDTRYVLAARMVKNKSEIPADIAKQMESAAMDFGR